MCRFISYKTQSNQYMDQISTLLKQVAEHSQRNDGLNSKVIFLFTRVFKVDFVIFFLIITKNLSFYLIQSCVILRLVLDFNKILSR